MLNALIKNGNQFTKTISYELKLIDSARFMTSTLPSLVENLAERIHRIKCKHKY